MAVYALGDIQGCYTELRQILDEVRFDPAQDRLWFVGDLVNRGPHSLEVLRFVRDLGDAAVSVLGNHDLHLLAIASGNCSRAGKDSLDEVLNAPDRDELIHWLRHRPLMHHDARLDFSLLHAGLPPQWTIAMAMLRAREVEEVLRDEQDHRLFLHDMYGNKPRQWSDELAGMERLRFITNCFTRLRFCTAAGRLHLKDKGPPGTQQDAGATPWFDVPGRASLGHRIVFGHWSTLGYLARNNVWGIDTGCLWGGELTLLRIDTPEPQAVHLSCTGVQDPRLFA
jgi:bis(5'-nucleosyl)-tetraphosphatase (symmetrical)